MDSRFPRFINFCVLMAWGPFVWPLILDGVESFGRFLEDKKFRDIQLKKLMLWDFLVFKRIQKTVSWYLVFIKRYNKSKISRNFFWITCQLKNLEADFFRSYNAKFHFSSRNPPKNIASENCRFLNLVNLFRIYI